MFFNKKIRLITTVALLLYFSVQAPIAAFELLTAEEIIAYAREGYKERQMGDPQGPRITVRQPDPPTHLRNPFTIEVVFSPQGRATVDPTTLIIKYNGFDVTQRIKSSGNAEISPQGIKVRDVEIRHGTYPFIIIIADNQGRVGMAELTLEVL